VDRGRLVTLVIKGCGCTLNYWEPEEIEGGFSETLDSFEGLEFSRKCVTERGSGIYEERYKV
jgi:hypothetical protein